MKKIYTVLWSKTYHIDGEVEIEAENEEEAYELVQESIGDYEGSLKYEGDYSIEVVNERESIVTQMARDLLKQAEKQGYKTPIEEERLAKFNKDNPTNRLQDLM